VVVLQDRRAQQAVEWPRAGILAAKRIGFQLSFVRQLLQCSLPNRNAHIDLRVNVTAQYLSELLLQKDRCLE
jgi:hypothetical protein